MPRVVESSRGTKRNTVEPTRRAFLLSKKGFSAMMTTPSCTCGPTQWPGWLRWTPPSVPQTAPADCAPLASAAGWRKLPPAHSPAPARRSGSSASCSRSSPRRTACSPSPLEAGRSWGDGNGSSTCAGGSPTGSSSSSARPGWSQCAARRSSSTPSCSRSSPRGTVHSPSHQACDPTWARGISSSSGSGRR